MIPVALELVTPTGLTMTWPGFDDAPLLSCLAAPTAAVGPPPEDAAHWLFRGRDENSGAATLDVTVGHGATLGSQSWAWGPCLSAATSALAATPAGAVIELSLSGSGGRLPTQGAMWIKRPQTGWVRASLLMVSRLALSNCAASSPVPPGPSGGAPAKISVPLTGPVVTWTSPVSEEQVIGLAGSRIVASSHGTLAMGPCVDLALDPLFGP